MTTFLDLDQEAVGCIGRHLGGTAFARLEAVCRQLRQRITGLVCILKAKQLIMLLHTSLRQLS